MTIEIVKELYTGTVETTGGRAGRAVSPDGQLDLTMSRPGTGKGANPELLLAAGWSACFQSALAHVARGRGVDVTDSVVTAHVTLGNDADGGFALKATLEVAIPGLDTATVEALAAETHSVCPYSRATRGNIDVTVVATA